LVFRRSQNLHSAYFYFFLVASVFWFLVFQDFDADDFSVVFVESSFELFWFSPDGRGGAKLLLGGWCAIGL